MQIKGLRRLKTLCDELGIITIKQLDEVYKANAEQGEDVITVLEKLKDRR